MRRLLPALPILVLLALPAAASAKPGQRMIFEAPRELRSGDAALRARTLDEIRGFGVNWLRVVMYWNDVAPNRNSSHVPGFNERDPAAGYDWSVYDPMIRDADARGMRILLTISGPVPKWATRSRRSHVTRPSSMHFMRFTEAVARRYGDVVDAYSIWNEPNHPDFLRPQWRGRRGHRTAVSPVLYRKLFVRGSAGLRRGGSGRAPILFGETAPRGTGRVVHPIRFLRRAFCLNTHWRKKRGCHKLRVSGYAHHAYTTRLGPYFRPPDRQDVTIGVLSRLNRALARAGRAHAVRRGLPIWLTEFGIQSRPDRVWGVGETAQAEYRAISERIAWNNRRVSAFSQYLMRDDHPIAGASSLMERYGGFESGLRHSWGRAKRAYSGFRMPLVALRLGHRRVRLWGLVRPAHGRTRVSIDYRNRGSKRWHLLKRDRTGRRGAWTTTTRYRRGRSYRVRWVAKDGTRYAGARTRVHRRR